MTEQSRRSFLRQVSLGGAVAGAAVLAPALLTARPAFARAAFARAAGPGTEYSIDLSMSAQTVAALNSGLYQLLVFKAVQSAATGGAPVVWASIGGYSEVTRLSWSGRYYAFAAERRTQRRGGLGGVASRPITSGQTLDVGAGAVGSVVEGGRSSAITIRNTTTTPFSCGLAQPSPNGGPTMPLCAFPLSGKELVAVKPLEKVALVFAAGPLRPGSVVRSSVGPTVLVDLGRDHAAELSYDIDGGWSGSASQAEPIPDSAFAGSLVVAGPAGPAGPA